MIKKFYSKDHITEIKKCIVKYDDHKINVLGLWS